MAYTIRSIKTTSAGFTVTVDFANGGRGLVDFVDGTTDVQVKSQLASIDSGFVTVSDPTSKLSASIRSLVGYQG